MSIALSTDSREWLDECEAREWLARIRAKKPRNVAEGTQMLDELIESIEKKRGKVAAANLRALIEKERAKK